MERRTDLEPNNFGAVRMIAAIFMIFSYSFFLTGRPEPVAGFLGYDTAGGIGVAMLFCIGGFFLTALAERNGIGFYFINILLRIVPPLMAIALVDIFIFGAFWNSIPFNEYILNPITIRHMMNWMVFYETPYLPGVFVSSPFPHVANASLWPLPVAGLMCFIVAMLMMGDLVRRQSIGFLFLLFFTLTFIGRYLYGLSSEAKGVYLLPGENVQIYSFLFFGTFFFCGGFYYFIRNQILYKLWYAVLALIMLFVSARGPHAWVAELLAIPYLTFYIAFGLPTHLNINIRRLGDLAYCLILLCFPVLQAVMSVFPDLPPVPLAGVAFLICLPLSWVMCWFVERPALRWLERIRVQQQNIEGDGVDDGDGYTRPSDDSGQRGHKPLS